jgi:serine/threonine-protein kinase HipA
LAELIRHKTASPQKTSELFKRMVFNVFIGNTDDHNRNHAFIYSFTTSSWHLSPAYDITPVNSSRIHDIGIGDRLRLGSIENLLSQAARFGLNQSKAQQIITDIAQYTTQWPQLFSQFTNVSEPDIERLKGVIPLIK